jgi:hypothetical protein
LKEGQLDTDEVANRDSLGFGHSASLISKYLEATTASPYGRRVKNLTTKNILIRKKNIRLKNKIHCMKKKFDIRSTL